MKQIDQPYFKNLDGLRFFCFLAVFLFHSFHTTNTDIHHSFWYRFLKHEIFGNGNLGVLVFFVLSGFLITYLMLFEFETRKKFNVFLFWMRRVLRIWPLYFLCVVIGFIGFPLLKSLTGAVSQQPDLLPYLAFYSNFDILKHGFPDASILGVLWSVGIEEQFYLVWPLLFLILPGKKFWIIPTLLIVISIFFRFSYQDREIHEYNTLSCMGDLSIGALGAWLVFYKNGFLAIIQNTPKWAIFLWYSLFGFIFFHKDNLYYYVDGYAPFDKTINSVLALGIILDQSFGKNSLFRLEKLKLICTLGRYTYGMYCLHFLAVLIVFQGFSMVGLSEEPWRIFILDPIVSLLVTILIAYCSFHFFEKPFLKLKKRFEA